MTTTDMIVIENMTIVIDMTTKKDVLGTMIEIEIEILVIAPEKEDATVMIVTRDA